MAIENELVNFSARIELDEATAKRVQESFDSISRKADETKERIEQTNAALMKMRMEGKENTTEFKAMEASLNADVKALKEYTKESDCYAKALGVQKMSLKQLREHAKQLRKEMAQTHNPKRPQDGRHHSVFLQWNDRQSGWICCRPGQGDQGLLLRGCQGYPELGRRLEP